jgi:hypothetical protein
LGFARTSRLASTVGCAMQQWNSIAHRTRVGCRGNASTLSHPAAAHAWVRPPQAPHNSWAHGWMQQTQANHAAANLDCRPTATARPSPNHSHAHSSAKDVNPRVCSHEGQLRRQPSRLHHVIRIHPGNEATLTQRNACKCVATARGGCTRDMGSEGAERVYLGAWTNQRATAGKEENACNFNLLLLLLLFLGGSFVHAAACGATTCYLCSTLLTRPHWPPAE